MPTSTATVRSANTVRANVRGPDDAVGTQWTEEWRRFRATRSCCRHHEQDRRQGRQRNEPGQRRGHHQDGEQRQGVDDAGDRRFRARSGCWSPYGRWPPWPGCRRPAARRYWRRPARPTRRWDCACRRSCCRRPPPTAGSRSRRSATVTPTAAAARSGRRGTRGIAEPRQAAWNAAELAADGLDVQAEHGAGDGRRQQGDDGTRDALRDARPKKDDGQGRHRQRPSP